MADISAMKGLKLYHQKENGDMEELTFTAGATRTEGRKLNLCLLKVLEVLFLQR